jgi:hypothetical protein
LSQVAFCQGFKHKGSVLDWSNNPSGKHDDNHGNNAEHKKANHKGDNQVYLLNRARRNHNYSKPDE